VGTGSACKSRCEADVEDLNVIIKRSKSAYQKTGGAYRRNGLVLLVLGCVFFVVGILPVITGRGYGTIFVAAMGLLFIVWSYFSFVNAKQISNIEE
jgi:Flp pilus assembly protein TadB